MHVVTEYPDGIFCWVDLISPDPQGAKSFYCDLFGWTAVDLPIDTGGVYTMFQIDEKNVAGLGDMPPDMQAQGTPPVWASYIKHSNVDEAAKNVAAAGGTVLFPPMDVMDSGRMTNFLDPTGAMVGIWQPKSHIGAQLVNQPNTLVWNELQTRDKAKATEFYRQAFGWSQDSDPSGYIMFHDNGRVHSGLMEMDDSWGEMPPNWSVYFMVEDVEAATERVQALGGTVLVPNMQAGTTGKFSVVQDPQGGTFTIMQFDGPVDLPPGHG